MNKYIESDLYRLKGKTSFKTFVKMYFRSGTFRWQVAYRLVRSTGISKLIGRILWKVNRSKGRIEIPRECDIGYGLYIGHGGPVVTIRLLTLEIIAIFLNLILSVPIMEKQPQLVTMFILAPMFV